ncbi:MAG TPA: hypothetical protein PKJ52_08490, partial [Rectinema sp.]|nr:hypothetical protein [Rectinema sp.]
NKYNDFRQKNLHSRLAQLHSSPLASHYKKDVMSLYQLLSLIHVYFTGSIWIVVSALSSFFSFCSSFVESS